MLFIFTNKSLITNISCTVRLVQRNFICSIANRSTVEASLVSVFTRRPICLESPELQELSPKLTPEVVESVLKSLRNWRLAQVFFNWASKQLGYSHTCYTYNAMAAILSSARQNAPLRDLAVSLSKSPCIWTPGALGYFLRCLGSQGLVEEANSLFDHVKTSRLCALNSYSYNCLLEVFAKSGNVSMLECRLNEMRSSSCPVDKHALTPALQCYCNARKFDKALMVFNDLIDKGWVDQHILGILVLSYSKCGKVDMAFELIEWAEKNLKVNLNQKTACVLIHGFVRECRVDKALELYDKTINLGFLPDISVYDVLIGGLCRDRELGKAVLLYKNMQQFGILPDVRIITQLLVCITEERDMIQLLEDISMNLNAGKRMQLYSSVLTGLVNDNNVDKAYHLLKAVIESGLNGSSRDKISSTIEQPGTSCFQTVIDGLCNIGKLDMALDLFQAMDKSGSKRNTLLFNNLIHCLSNADRLKECFDLLNEMKRSEFKPTHFTFNCILGCLCRRMDVEGALDLLREMRGCGHDPWIKHYTLLVKKLCEVGKASESYKFLSEMTKEGFLPDLIAFAATIDGFINVNELDRGLKLFREICERGYCPDVVTYNTIIKGLCKAKRTAEAEDIWDEILGKGLVPSVATYNLLIDGWCKDGNINKAVQYFSRMIEEEQEASVITYTILVDGLCNAGKPDEALNLWSEMERKGCKPNRIAYMALIHGLCKCQKPDVALIYLERMEDNEMVPETYVYKSLVDAFAFSSNTAMANEILKKMAKRCTASISR
ncbi:Putative pentatricopeptide repeat-containing protein - mitochondrial [Striga hermonthica]|uniref:Pentatricopeptide repeat-containing protein - mitochondrial n=1 Tax=Striga hermonthica TaxID=68872 RepID=A0A9N7NA58_STRHE|nr:Putative pentatricopeptide repeat-containing protein - mitochondrial [Striga hermonthica]